MHALVAVVVAVVIMAGAVVLNQNKEPVISHCITTRTTRHTEESDNNDNGRDKYQPDQQSDIWFRLLSLGYR
jgi:hypothetical protein